MNDPTAARDVTAAAHRRREQRSAGESDEPGRLRASGNRTPPNDRDGGYGSEHGLAADDPAYREEQRLPPAPKPRESSADRDAPRLGGDERRAPEDEHL